MNSLDILSSMKEFSEKIQSLVAEADWDLLNTVLTERQQVLEQFFSSVESSEESDLELISFIEQIQAKDDLFLSSIQSQKGALEKQRLILKKGRQSVKAYQ